MDKTKISWCDATWNPIITGCTKCSDGCDNCYAYATAEWLNNFNNKRYVHAFETTGHPFGLTIHDNCCIGKDGQRCTVRDLNIPLAWTKPRLIFLGSMYDIGHPKIPDWVLEAIFSVMNRATWHYFLVLTKRPKHLLKKIKELGLELGDNIGVGVTVEKMKYRYRIKTLKQIPAKMRFISAEPLLDNIGDAILLDPYAIDWVITGGESGKKYRTANPHWFAIMADICFVEGIAFHHKQNGGNVKCQEKHGMKDNCKAKGCRLIRGKIIAEYPPIIAKVLGRKRPKNVQRVKETHIEKWLKNTNIEPDLSQLL